MFSESPAKNGTTSSSQTSSQRTLILSTYAYKGGYTPRMDQFFDDMANRLTLITLQEIGFMNYAVKGNIHVLATSVPSTEDKIYQ